MTDKNPPRPSATPPLEGISIGKIPSPGGVREAGGGFSPAADSTSAIRSPPTEGSAKRGVGSPIISYSPRLKSRARDLRQSMTLAEVLLWKRIKGRQMLGHDFDRQRPMGKYIVDFYCKTLRLAIEVDGRSHDFKETQDFRRQGELEQMGVGFLRFWDSEVKTDMQSVLDRIQVGIRLREQEIKNPPRPVGTPPLEGISIGKIPSPGGVREAGGGFP